MTHMTSSWLTVAKSQIFKVLSSEAETRSLESEDHDTSDIPWGKKVSFQNNFSYKWRAWWKKCISDDLRLKSQLVVLSWTLAHRLIFIQGKLLCIYFLPWELQFEELEYYFCFKLMQRKQQDSWFKVEFLCFGSGREQKKPFHFITWGSSVQ